MCLSLKVLLFLLLLLLRLFFYLHELLFVMKPNFFATLYFYLIIKFLELYYCLSLILYYFCLWIPLMTSNQFSSLFMMHSSHSKLNLLLLHPHHHSPNFLLLLYFLRCCMNILQRWQIPHFIASWIEYPPVCILRLSWSQVHSPCMWT